MSEWVMDYVNLGLVFFGGTDPVFFVKSTTTTYFWNLVNMIACCFL